MLEGYSKEKREEKASSVQMDGGYEKPKPHTSPTHTREQVAKLSGVGTGTVARYDAVMKSDDEELGRRNLSPIQRIAVAEKYRPIYEKQARENQLSGLKQNQISVSQNSSKRNPIENKIDVRAKLAETANVSTDTYSKGKKILDSDNNEVKNAVLSGDMSINAGYNKIRENEKKKENIKEESSNTDTQQIKPSLPLQSKSQISDETNIRQRGDIGGSVNKIGKRIKELERIYGVRAGSNNMPGSTVGEKISFTQEDLAKKMGMDVRTLQNYKLLSDMIPELEDLIDTGIVTKTTALAMMRNLAEDLQDEDSKLRALISNNFGRRKNDPSKDRKALETYVSVRGYKQGRSEKEKKTNMDSLTLDEIAKELNMSKTNLKCALRIERNLTDSMKELLDSGEISKTLAADTIALYIKIMI